MESPCPEHHIRKVTGDDAFRGHHNSRFAFWITTRQPDKKECEVTPAG